jgi:glycosyltransferase involved in cell wall biosynthesis
LHVLLVHNYYQIPGGEDDVFLSEKALLEAHGHRTSTYVRNNSEIKSYSLIQKAALTLKTTWAWDSEAAFKELLEREKPELAHFHNTFPLISPAAYHACQNAGVPVVQTLHNARLLCPGSNYYRDGHICRDCLGKIIPWPGTLHGCYRDSRAQSAVATAMLGVHNLLGTFRGKVDSYIVSTDFYRHLFVEGGLPESKLFIKPHFVTDPGYAQRSDDYVLFVGRLAHEKGVNTLAEAWGRLPHVPLKVRGEGPLQSVMEDCARRNPNVELLPWLERNAYLDLIRGARFLVWPSVGYYETFGMVAILAFACGVPIIASRIGANAELVNEGETGVRFNPEDAPDLAAKVDWAWKNPEAMQAMGKRARAEYENKYTPERNYSALISIYERTLSHHS